MEEYVFSWMNDLSYVMEWQVIILTLLNIRISECDAANEIDAWPVGKQWVEIIIFITVIIHIIFLKM